MIKIKKLSKFYGKNQVLNSIDLEFEKGKIYGIVGENGAGKTTLFRCISGLENYKGNISYDNTKLKDHLGLLLTEPFFFSKITGKEYIQLLANTRQIELSNIENKNFYNIFNESINNNKQAVLNNSLSDHFQTILFVPWEIDQISILEKWSKYKNIPFQELVSIELIIDKQVITLSSKQLEELAITINLQSLEEYISEKRFTFLLEEINTQEIAPQQSETYYKALQTNPWNKITH